MESEVWTDQCLSEHGGRLSRQFTVFSLLCPAAACNRARIYNKRGVQFSFYRRGGRCNALQRI